jgi:hypothetical protein
MNLTTFTRLLDAKGPHLVTWDVRDRMAAATLMANSEAARAVFDEALALDRALTAAAPEISEARLLNFVDRVVAAAPARAPKGDVRFTPQPRSFQNGLAAAFATACFVVGIVIGSGVETGTSVDLAGLPLGPTTTITIGIE